MNHINHMYHKKHTADGICIPSADRNDNISDKQCGSKARSEFDI